MDDADTAEFERGWDALHDVVERDGSGGTWTYRGADDDTPAAALVAAAEVVRAAVANLDAALEALTTADEIADLLGVIYDARRELQFAEGIVGQELLESVVDPFDAYPIPTGGGIIRFRGGNRPKRFDGDLVRSRLVDAITDDLVDTYGRAILHATTGEVAGLREVVDDVAERMAEVTGAVAPSFTGWRAGVAKRYGIRLKDYQTEGESTPIVPVIEGRDRK